MLRDLMVESGENVTNDWIVAAAVAGRRKRERGVTSKRSRRFATMSA
jgi:hypothetical protein